MSGEGFTGEMVDAVHRMIWREPTAKLDLLHEVSGDHRAAARQVENDLANVMGALSGMGLAQFVDVDFTIVRGLDYYTGTVFELFDAGKTLRAICGGGRYDNLTGAIGGVELGAVGFGMGDVVLGELLKEKGLVPPHASSIDVFLAAITEDDVPELLKLAHELRDAGIRVEYPLGVQAVGKQLKLADARNALFSVVIGPDDREKHQVILKDLRAKGQMPVPRAEIVADLRKRLKAHDPRLTTHDS
ncbi:MAG: ATP phosphoribosyltransferase regulatory subunit [Gemmatimonadales bacterium]